MVILVNFGQYGYQPLLNCVERLRILRTPCDLFMLKLVLQYSYVISLIILVVLINDLLCCAVSILI
jgi:hypothetical protein